MNRKLGKLAPKVDRRTFALRDFLALPAPPMARDWAAPLGPTGPMFRNDAVGDCTCAAVANLVRVWTANHGHTVTLTDDDVLAAYAAVTGYDGTPETDNGAAMLDVLNYWRNTGIGGHKIGAFVRVNLDDLVEVQSAINLLGGLYVGASLPLSAQRESTWLGGVATTPDDRPGSWGGHAMALSTYDRGGVEFLTWGQRQAADWAWVSRYADEAYACLSVDWVDGTAPAPNGFDLERLRAALSQL